MSKFKTPVLPLSWVYISGKGAAKYGKQFTSENALDFEFKASAIIDAKGAKEIEKTIKAFWAENKPAKIVKPSSTFLKEELVESDELDEYGAKIKKPTGKYVISASTNTHFKGKDGLRANAIAMLNSKAKPFPATHPLVTGDVGVGDGSIGVIHGTLAITEYEGKAYVKLYLKGVQFAKFIPYEGDNVDADEIEGYDDDGCGCTTDGCDADTIDAQDAPEI